MIGSAVFLSGCQPDDEVSERTKNIGFAAEQAKPEKIVPSEPEAAPAENPINALSQEEGIQPATLSIPAVGIEAEVLHLATEENGDMAVPKTAEDVSWFEPGYAPGQNGRAVIAGHVDAVEGPAVFWDLADLEAGDEIIVAGSEGELTFKVYAMESVALALADVKDVFGYRSTPELVLITCSGEFNFERGTREERLIVYAQLSTS